MGKLVVSLDGVVIKEVQITKDKTTLGRRPYNDMVIDNLAVSGEHAVLQMVGGDVFIEDLNSTNGTYINGKPIKKQLLANHDTIEIGKYKIKYLTDDGHDYEKTLVIRPGAVQPQAFRPTQPPPASGFGSPFCNSPKASSSSTVGNRIWWSGFWNRMPTSRTAARRSRARSSPLTRQVPCPGATSPATSRASVDLPEPLRPTTPSRSTEAEKLMSCRTVLPSMA